MPNNRIFHSLLTEEYLKTIRTNVDVVTEKKKRYNDLLTAANNALKKKDVKVAKDLYSEVLKFVNDDPYPDELNLKEETIYYIKCCYCYSYLTYFQVDQYFVETQDSLDNLNDILEFLRVTYPNKLIPVYLQIIYNLANESWVSVLEQCEIFEKNEKIEQEIITDLMFKDLLPNIDEIRKTKDKAMHSYFINKRLKDKDDVEYRSGQNNMTDIDLCHRTRTMQTEESKKDAGQQTDRIMLSHKHIQTGKQKNSECQVDFNEEYSQTLQDIKTKLQMVQQKCDFTVQCLNEKLSDIQIKLNEENQQNKALREHYDGMCAKYEVEIMELKDTLEVSKKLKELETKNNSKLQKLLLDLLQDKYYIRKTICDSLIDKAYFMISYLGELVPVLTQNTIPDRATVQKDIDYWHNQITNYTAHIAKLNDIYNTSKSSIINSGNLDLTKSWPDLLKFLKDSNNIIFNSFKPAIRRIIDSEQRMTQYMNSNPLTLQPFPMNSGPPLGQHVNVLPNIYFQRPFDRMNYFHTQNYQPLNSQPSNSSPIYSHNNSAQNYPPQNSSQNYQPNLNNQYNPERSRTPSNNTDSNVSEKNCKTSTISENQTNKTDASSFIKHKNNQDKNNSSVNTVSEIEIEMEGACSIFGPPKKSDINLDEKNKQDKAKNCKKSVTSGEDIDNGVAFSLLDLPNKDTEFANLLAPLKEDLERIYSKPSTPDDHKMMSSDELLFKYILENCPDTSEQDATIALLDVLEQNGGSYMDIPKENILTDVLIQLKLKENQQLKKMKQIQKTNKKLDESCTICFENFRTAKTFSLPCQHVYHKHCIKRWLNKSNYCPICRHPSTVTIK